MRDEKKIRLTPHQAKIRIEKFCAYRERAHTEVRAKLYSFGLHSPDVNQIMANLVENNFLNEERYAMAFVSGKFRIKSWGIQRIERELKKKQINPWLIRKALSQIESAEYDTCLRKLTERKWKQVREKHPLKKIQKVVRYLVSKGYSLEDALRYTTTQS